MVLGNFQLIAGQLLVGVRSQVFLDIEAELVEAVPGVCQGGVIAPLVEPGAVGCDSPEQLLDRDDVYYPERAEVGDHRHLAPDEPHVVVRIWRRLCVSRHKPRITIEWGGEH